MDTKQKDSMKNAERKMEGTERRYGRCNCIDWKLLPIKLHFFLFYGAVGCIIAYIQLLAKQIGLSATAVGIVYTVQPFLILFSKPIFGVIVDHFKNLKLVMAILIVVTACSYFVVPFIPPIPKIAPLNSQSPMDSQPVLRCQGSVCAVKLSPDYDRSCVEDLAKRELTCDFSLYRKKFSVWVNSTADCKKSCFQDIANFYPLYMTNASFFDERIALVMEKLPLNSIPPNTRPFDTKNVGMVVVSLYDNINSYENSFGGLLNAESYEPNISDSFDGNSSSCECTESVFHLTRCTPSLQECKKEGNSTVSGVVNIYATYQFWTFSIFAIIAGTTSATMFCLSDAACCEALGDETEKYGKQRMWATLSWGSVSFLTGFLNDIASVGSDEINYFPGFYLMISLLSLDLIVLYYIKITSVRFSTSIWKDIGRIFSSSEIVCFAMGVFIVGGLTGFLWNYKFWYLQDLGASQLLLGLTVGVQCLFAEMPFFFLSGYIIKALGHYTSLVATFAAFTLRFSLYSLLQNPWYTLPIELLHGQTYAAFYASMTSYAKTNAPPGTEATMLGILGGLFEGLGVAVGSVLTGVGYDTISGRYTFFAAAVVSAFCAVSFLLLRMSVRTTQRYF